MSLYFWGCKVLKCYNSTDRCLNLISTVHCLCDLEVKWSEIAQSCLTLCDPMDCKLPGSSIHGIFQWVAISFSRGSSQPRDWTQVSWIVGRCFTIWATREVLLFYNSSKKDLVLPHINYLTSCCGNLGCVNPLSTLRWGCAWWGSRLQGPTVLDPNLAPPHMGPMVISKSHDCCKPQFPHL